MPHKSESNIKISIREYDELSISNINEGSVSFFNLGTTPRANHSVDVEQLKVQLSDYIEALPSSSAACFLCDSQTAMELIPIWKQSLKFRLWVAVRRENPIERPGNLPDDHAALLIFTVDEKPFQHAKLQIEYSICPACNKTTKDYGGKKHLYSPYGTLMSDIWRDMRLGNCHNLVIDRLADLFGVEPYIELLSYDISESIIWIENEELPAEVPRSDNLLESALINNDCIEALGNLPESSIDFAFADPPYNINKKYDTWDDGIQIEEYFNWCDEWIDAIYRVLKPGAVFCIINIPLWVARHFLHAKQQYQFLDYICWEGLSLPVRNIMPAHYGLLSMSKGRANPLARHDQEISPTTKENASMTIKEWYCVRQSCVKKRNTPNLADRQPITNIWWDIHRLKHNSRRVDHPCQLPPDLMKRLIYTYTNEGDIVLDPFNGAGTTSLVAQLMNRKYIGIELSEKYHVIATERHQEINEGIDPFRKAERKISAKNSRVARRKKQKYVVSKKVLQLDVKRIAEELGKKPTKEEVKELSKYPFEYFEDYFIDWGEVCGAVGKKGMNENI